ncbi:Lipid A core - O-antigen ligase and related enzymes [Providencia rustigianii]|uniref:Lipid A core - O-antigen ligase and related enzymes n=1 Tax=Providencia rustigianii TaxID=158850 RepID=A0A379G8W8_9GAMM|nr:O-antigen ligase family protein [Providencia rustigianii]SUC37321.1 Lipid A core - O-antigen ligase and related enzymes [Providencia rustigianii]
MNNIRNVINQFPFLLLFLVTLGMFTNDTQGVLNVSAALLFLYTLYIIITKKINVFSALIQLIKGRKFLFLFCIWCLLCAIFFTYSGFMKDALKALFDDWRYVVILTLFLITFQHDEIKSKNIITYALIVTLAFIIFIVPILKLIKGSDMAMYLQLRYGFAHYMTLLFPFTFSAFFIFEKAKLKILMLCLSIMAFLFLLYTGSRGGFLSITIESLIILFLLSKNNKKFLLNIFSFMLLGMTIIIISYFTIPQVKNKVEQTLYSKDITSTRDKIAISRFPIFMQTHLNQLVGVGYGSVAYDQYLKDNNALQFQGGMGYSKSRNESFYNNDEPFFLNILYNIGSIGLFLFCITFFINIKDLIKSIKIEKNILNVGLLVSSIGYFLVYCLFEFIFLDIFILYNILTAIFINRVLTKK